MTNSLIAIALLGIVIFQLYYITQRVKDYAYQWWYMPWFALVYSGLMFFIYYKVDIPDLSFIQQWLYEEYQVEAVYSILCIAIWMGLQLLLRDETIHEKLIKPFRSLFAPGRDDKDHVLPFPYFIDWDGVVRAKVGQVFYRWTMKFFVLILALIYATFFILLRFEVISDFYPKSAFGILGLLPLIDYFVYLCSEVPVEKAVVEGDPKGRSDFDELWQLYVDTFDNYSVAWKKTNTQEDLQRIREWGKDNDEDIRDMIKDFTDMSKRSDAIIEKYDIATAFMKLEPVFDHVERNGRHILIALDVPNHFSFNQEGAFTDDIAAQLTKIIRRNFFVYGKKSSQPSLSNSIVVSSLSLLSRQAINEEWMKKIGLITVINVFDKGVSNMYECRKFCYILRSMNKDYQVIFVTPYRRGMEPSMMNTWLTATKPNEKRMRLYPKGEKQFFIGYDFEDFKDRFRKILTSAPTEPLYSGSEMAPIALSSVIGERKKVVTPVHYLDLAYSNAIEGKEELNKFYDLISNFYLVSKENINQNMVNHLLPVDQIDKEQVFAVVYDVDNNAPSIYSKWVHLGSEENFSIVISKPYLFRDYFNANHDYFVIAPFAALQPHLCKSRLTLAIILLNMLQKAEMEEKNLREMLRYYYESEIVSVSAEIKSLFKTYFSNDLASMLMSREEIIFDGEKYEHLRKYNLFQLTDANIPSYLGVVTIKDESGNVLLDLLNDLMYQNYDKGQTHSFSGKPYMIKDFSRSTMTLNVSSVNNKDNDILFYKPIQAISLGKERTAIEGMNLESSRWRHPITGEWLSVAFEGFETLVEVQTTSWYEFYKYNIKGFEEKDSYSPARRYPNGKVLKITFGYLQKLQYKERINDIRKSLQILLYEAIQSIFPHHAQYLIISSMGDIDQDLPWIFNDFGCPEQQAEGELSFYFIEDAHIDLGLIGALAVDGDNIRYILKYIYDYLIWLTEGNGDSVSTDDNGNQSLNDVANWEPNIYDIYLDRKNVDKLSFLKYGREKLPIYFDINLMINFIKDLFESDKELLTTSTDRQTKNNVIGACDFCGKKMKNNEMQRLDDGRMRCPDCSIDAIDTTEQFIDLCDKVKEAFKTYLGIDFSNINHNAKLVSAVELHKEGGYTFAVTNGYDIRKIIGLACNSSIDEFFVENGYKPDKTFGIIAHEMTHIWEYNNEDFQKVRKTNEDLVEGLAVWTDLYLCEKKGMTDTEERRRGWLSRTDEYGRGLQFIMENCPDDPYGYIRDQAKKITV